MVVMSTHEDDLRLIRKVSQNDPDPTDDQVNATALSWGTEPQEADGVASGGLPCIQVAGVTVWLYRKDGRMIISIDTDDADGNTPYMTHGADDQCVAMQVDVNGVTVWADMDDQEATS
jgi:hypothetical protein